MEKIKNFFKKLFSRNKVLKIEQRYETNRDKEGKNIRDSVRVEKGRLELFKLQEKFEKNELDLYSLSKKQLQELTKLYEEQVKELNYKLGTTRNSET